MAQLEQLHGLWGRTGHKWLALPADRNVSELLSGQVGAAGKVPALL